MSDATLGLDIGGANLKAATPGGLARSVAFPLWKHPDRLPAALAELVAYFPPFTQLAVTMTGELCDCFATKREGVGAILTAVESVSRSHPVRVWGTDGRFRGPNAARADWLRVAAANWHALATFAAAFNHGGCALVIDIGSTTADLVCCQDGEPVPVGRTDPDRMRAGELVYTGVRRTPVCAVLPAGAVAAELFATTLDAWLVTGHVRPDAADTDTADGRPATVAFAHARLARMLGGDAAVTPAADTAGLAEAVTHAQTRLLADALDRHRARLGELKRTAFRRTCVAVLSGSGEFLARDLAARYGPREYTDVVSLTDRLGPEVAACAPAYAVAKLAAERPL